MSHLPFPKAELHVHLDGSLRAGTLLTLAREQGISLPFHTETEAREALCFQSGWDLGRCLSSFATTLQVLQTPEGIERVAYELCEDLHHDGVTYAEIRYCPSLHLQRGMNPRSVVDHVAKGMDRAEKEFGLTARQIITILRNWGNDAAIAQSEADTLVHLAAATPDLRVVGVDLAGDEYHFPPELFERAFTYAKDAGLHRTVHAGEGGSVTTPNIRTAIERLHAERIGHGVAARHDWKLLRMLKDRNIALEVCPTSNVHTGSVSDYQNHPARHFFEDGITIIPCADNTLLSQTCTSREYQHLSTNLGFNGQEVEKIARESFDARFS